MYNGKSILALITARGGSKGIPGKNIKKLGDKPLICWTIEAAKLCPYIDRLIISTNDLDIIKIAESAGCEVPFQRPEELSEDTTPSMDVILHAVAQLNEKYDYLLLLQPTSPFRTARHIDEIIEKTIEHNINMMVSVKKVKCHPSFLFEIQNGFLSSFSPKTIQSRRQDMPTVYQHNGALYLSKLDYLFKHKSFLVAEAMPFLMKGISNIDIDEPEDWLYCESLIQKFGMEKIKIGYELEVGVKDL